MQLLLQFLVNELDILDVLFHRHPGPFLIERKDDLFLDDVETHLFINGGLNVLPQFDKVSALGGQ